MKLVMKYSKVNCEAIESLYINHQSGSTLGQDAFTEWKLQNRYDEREAPALGYLQCFCEEKMKENDPADKIYFSSPENENNE